MVFLEIVMIIIGLFAVIYSFRMTDNHNEGKKGSGKDDPAKEEVNDEELEHIVSGKEEKLRECAEEIFQETDNRLGDMFNEKIMGMSEYSDQVLDKIEKNHAEAVFLYDMLSEKQEEIKKLIHEMDEVKADLHNTAAVEYQKLKEQENTLIDLQKSWEADMVRYESSRKDAAAENPTIGNLSEEEADAFEELLENHAEEKAPDDEEIQTSVFDAEIAQIEEDEKQEGKEDTKYRSYQEEEIKNHNEEIISLYKKGRSVLEISKMLSIGQGEVKFVIDMYNAR